MKVRVVQIWGFLMTVLGWIFVACTMAMEGWKISSVGGQGGTSIITVAWHWSSLWRKCFTDSTAVSNCYDFPALWSVEGDIQVVRGLLMAALSLGMLGFILSLLGMECTYIGGKDRSKHKKIYSGGLCHVISGALSTSGYAVYAQYVSMEVFNPDFTGLRFDLGTPLFLGWVGSAFQMAGGFFHLWSVCKPLCGGGEATVIAVQAQPDPEQNKSTTALSTVSEITSKTKLSSISELSSRSDGSDVSSISTKSRSGRSSATGRTARSIGSAGSSRSSRSSRSGSRSELQSRLSSRSSQSASSASRSGTSGSRTVSSLSGSLRSETEPFVKNKNTYI